MTATLEMPQPHLSKGRFASIDVLTDESLFKHTGIRIAFTSREGGVSSGVYNGLNLSMSTGDEAEAVEKNRLLLKTAFNAADKPCIVPTQVHGDHIVVVSGNDTGLVGAASQEAEAGADAVVIGAVGVSSLLCFADCVPVIIASPTGRFAVVHAGWRGALIDIAAKAAYKLAEIDEQNVGENLISSYNAYIGPHIQSECFETSKDVHDGFVEAFGQACAADDTHIDLDAVIRTSLERAGITPHRVVSSQICTVCNNDAYFSYRAQDGSCGRQGAFAVCLECA